MALDAEMLSYLVSWKLRVGVAETRASAIGTTVTPQKWCEERMILTEQTKSSLWKMVDLSPVPFVVGYSDGYFANMETKIRSDSLSTVGQKPW
jgi:hypothetical protein